MLHDLVKSDGSMTSVADLGTEFNMQIRPMDYNSLVMAIPMQWKNALKKMRIPPQAVSNQEQPAIVCSGRPLALGIVTNKDIYWKLVVKKQTKPIVINNLCNQFNIRLEDWKMIFKPYLAIKDARTKAFQFKILYNLLPCNLYLKRIGKSNTDKCPNCNMLDDQMHYLVECAEVAAIWRLLSRWWKGIADQDIVFNARDIIIGLEQRTEKTVMKMQLEEIILAVKWKIYANKQTGENTCFHQVLCSIRNMLNIQKLIASRNDKVTKHAENWGKIERYLT
jgi:hypothetical protein